MGNEKFCLRWNDFENNISVAFRELREDKDFFDVTLACDDEQIQAHKVILSACSPFFEPCSDETLTLIPFFIYGASDSETSSPS